MRFPLPRPAPASGTKNPCVIPGVIYVTRGVLNGVGDALFSFINSIVEISGRVGLPLLLLHYTTAGVWSIWITAGVTWLLAGSSCVLRYISWRKKREGVRGAGRLSAVKRFS